MATPATVIPASSDGSRKELSQARLRRRLSSRREQLGYSRLHRELGVQQRSARDREEGNWSHDMDATPPPGELLGITVHRTDVLHASVKVAHPVVRVSVVDGEGGRLLKKSNPERCVASFYEMGNPTVDYVLPIMTQPCHLQEHCLQPEWEECLLLNEQVEYFSRHEHLILFFELLDFSAPSSRLSPWYRIAWAFLQPRKHMGQRCRLQLYQYPTRSLCPANSIEVYELWSHRQLKPYSSTLHVTLQTVAVSDLPPHPPVRSMAPTQEEVGSVGFEQLLLGQQASRRCGYLNEGAPCCPELLYPSLLPSTASLATLPHPSLSLRTRLPGQSCRVPLTPLISPLHPSTGGCSALAFSCDGRFLAAACADDEHYPIIILEVVSYEKVLIGEGHCSLIHGLCWAPDSTALATASADGLAKVWSLERRDGLPSCVLPHPCFVYAICFTCSAGHLFTGAYDGIIRLWKANDGTAHVLQELQWHVGLVNSLSFCSDSHVLYSADSHGRIGVWREEKGCWRLHRHITTVEGHPITSLSLHCNTRKLLVQSSDGFLATLDLRIGSVCCEYQSSLRVCGGSVLSPCGGLVFAGGDKGSVGVWRSDNGQLVHSYTELPLQCPVSAIACHPREHTAAFSAFGPYQPLIVITADQISSSSSNHPSAMLTKRLEHVNQTLAEVHTVS